MVQTRTKIPISHKSTDSAGISENAFPDSVPETSEIIPIAELIKLTRKNKGLSQKALAAKTGITNVHLSRIENGEANPSVRTLVKLAPILGYSLEDLLIASHYQGELPSSTPTYLDFNGNIIDLISVVSFMYHTDGELLLLLWTFYQNYSASDSELLKIIIKSINECQNVIDEDLGTHNSNNDTSKEDISNQKNSSDNLFISAFNDLKQFIFSFDKIVHPQTL